MPDARELPSPDGLPLFDAGSPAGESASPGASEQAPDPSSVPATFAAAAPQPSLADRLLSFGEVVMCSGFPTQLAVTVLLLAAGTSALDNEGGLSLRYVVWLSAIDTVLVIGLALLFLRLRGERPAVVLLGSRPALAEAVRGLLLLAPTFLLLIAAALLIERAAPWLRSTERNPFESLLQTPTGLVAFAAVAIFAGGLREEIQRAFVLHRFDQHLGGVWLGLVLFSLAFGAGHALQGWDAAVMTGVLGALWGYVYIRRRSIVAPVVCHAAFNLLEVAFHGLQA